MSFNTKKSLNLLLVIALLWLIESTVHFFVFSEESFVGALWLSVSIHELYMRFLIVVSCILLFLLVGKNRMIMEREAMLQNILDNILPVCVTNKDYEIVIANDAYWRFLGKMDQVGLKCFEHRPGEDCQTERCPMVHILRGENEYCSESVRVYEDHTHHFIIRARPFLDYKGKLLGIIETFQDITVRKNLEEEKTKLVDKLQASLDKVKLLSGFLPICASCKKIRDDKGYWTQIEGYIRDHSEAEFSHGICPECVEKLYPDYIGSNEKK